MFWPNAGPADYRYRCKLESSQIRSGTQGLLVGTSLQVRYGEDFATAATGIEVRVQNRVDAGSGTWYHEVKIDTPWAGIVTPVSAVNFDPDMEAILILEGAYVNVLGCTDWQFHLDLLELYFENSVVYSLTNKNDNGSSYSRRMLTVKGGTYTTINPAASFVMPACSAPDAEAEVQAAPSTIGWQKKVDGVWTAYPVALDLSQTIPEPASVVGCDACDCQDTLPEISVDEIELSWQIELYGVAHSSIESSATSQHSCQCSCNGTPCGTSWTYECHMQDVHYYSRSAEIQAAPMDAGILTHVRESGSKCWCCEATEPESYTVNGPDTDNEEFTYAAFSHRVDNFIGSQGCCTVLTQGSCPFGNPEDPEPEPPPANCGFGPLECCAYRAYRQITWNEPTCNCEHADLLAFHSGEVWVACVDGTNIKVKHKQTANAVGWDLEALATSSGVNSYPCLAIDYRIGALVLEYEKQGSGTMRRYSFDMGATWSSEEVAISGGSFPRVAAHPTGKIIRAALVSNKLKAQLQYGGDTTPGALFTFKDSAGTDITVSTTHAFGLTYSYGGSDLLLGAFTLSGATEVTYWQSADEGSTWIQVT